MEQRHNRENIAKFGGQVEAQNRVSIGILRKTHYKVECFRNGELIWTDDFDNIVVNEGLDDSLDKHLKGSGYTAAWYVGLTDGTPTVIAGNTMAVHAGWVEVTDYDEVTREVLTLGAVSGQSVDNSASKAQFTINGTVTVGGAFVTTANDKGGGTGTLYGAGAFTTGDRALLAADVLNVTVTLTAAAA